jgi:hypothetical protein
MRHYSEIPLIDHPSLPAVISENDRYASNGSFCVEFQMDDTGFGVSGKHSDLLRCSLRGFFAGQPSE